MLGFKQTHSYSNKFQFTTGHVIKKWTSNCHIECQHCVQNKEIKSVFFKRSGCSNEMTSNEAVILSYHHWRVHSICDPQICQHLSACSLTKNWLQASIDINLFMVCNPEEANHKISKLEEKQLDWANHKAFKQHTSSLYMYSIGQYRKVRLTPKHAS